MATTKTCLQDPVVWATAFLILFNPCFWNAVGRYEYRTKAISKRVGNNRTAVYLVAVAIFSLGLIRDVLFELSIRRCPINDILYKSAPLKLFGFGLLVCGWTLVLTSMYRLGIVGTYLGDHFGILFDERITAFPFSTFDHPMYEGATMVFMGTAVVQGSLVGIGLAGLAGIVYTVAGWVEGPFTAKIYSQHHTRKDGTSSRSGTPRKRRSKAD